MLQEQPAVQKLSEAKESKKEGSALRWPAVVFLSALIQKQQADYCPRLFISISGQRG
jgi:hypothetical protein